MMLTEETTLPASVLPLTAFKAHLHLGTGFTEANLQDELLEGFLRAALAAIEARTGKTLLERAFVLELPRWSDARCQPLPLGPVNDVSEIVLRDAMGSDTPVSPAFWRLERDSQQSSLRAPGGVLPAIPQGGRAIVHLRAGMAASWGELPADLAQAVLMLAAHFYEYRQDTGLGRGCMPFGVSSLIERYRGLRLSLGAPSSRGVL
jgi:uncharacterized phiE125 gp8 family phage protein